MSKSCKRKSISIGAVFQTFPTHFLTFPYRYTVTQRYLCRFSKKSIKSRACGNYITSNQSPFYTGRVRMSNNNMYLPCILVRVHNSAVRVCQFYTLVSRRWPPMASPQCDCLVCRALSLVATLLILRWRGSCVLALVIHLARCQLLTAAGATSVIYLCESHFCIHKLQITPMRTSTPVLISSEHLTPVCFGATRTRHQYPCDA